jgi:uncharacterized membrane protein
LLHDSFRTGITLKGFDGLLEAVGGALLWFVPPSSMTLWVRELCVHELSRDSRDFIAVHLLHVTNRLAQTDPTFASIYLISHGLTKALLVVALWMNKLWAYPLTVGVFSAFMVYQIYRYMHTRSVFLLVLTIFDALVVYLTWQEYRVQKSERGQK